MCETLHHLKIAAAWRLLERCHWIERLLWEHYDHDFIERYIWPDLAREVEEPPELLEELDLDDIHDDIPF